jgi:hypothetical protein
LAIVPNLRHYPELDGKTFLVGVGANKCATSWIHSYLGSSPEVAASPLKEVHFFNARFDPSTSSMDLFALKRLAFHFRQDGDVVENLRNRASFQASLDRAAMIHDDNAYFGHFARICQPQTRTLCDITPAYSAIGQTGFQYMKDFFASQDVSLKILFIMRDPVDRLWSHLRYRQQNHPDLDILTAWPEMIADPQFLAWSDYRQTVEALDTVFQQQDTLFLFYEDMFSKDKLADLCAFADVAYVEPDTGRSVNRTELQIDLPETVADDLRSTLAPQYDFCRQRFANMLPASWRA